MNSDFSDLLKTLNDGRVKYLIVGKNKLTVGRPQDLMDVESLKMKKRDEEKIDRSIE